MQKLRVAVLASGNGSNLQSIIDQMRAGKLDIELVQVIANNPDAGALDRAAKAGIAHQCINHRHFTGREGFDEAVVRALVESGAELVVLAGFMRIISAVFLRAFAGRIINIHPSLLPAFAGLHVHQKALDYGAKFSGCSVHFVDGGVDTGPIIVQAVVPILPDDDADTLAARILAQEHKIYPQAIQWIAEGRVAIDGRKVIIKEAQEQSGAQINPPLEPHNGKPG